MTTDDEPTLTFHALLEAFEADPTDLETGEELARITDRDDRWNELTDICNGWLVEGKLVRSAQISLMLTLSRWYADLERPEFAFHYINQILQIVPEHLGALEAMAVIFEDEQNHEALDMVRERIDEVKRGLEDNEQEDEDDEQEDEDNFDELLARLSRYADEDSLKELGQLAERMGKWNELLNHCNALISEGEIEPETELAVTHALGRWYAYLEHPDYAIAYFNRCLTLDAEHLPSLRQMVDIYRHEGDDASADQVEARIRNIIDRV